MHGPVENAQPLSRVRNVHTCVAMFVSQAAAGQYHAPVCPLALLQPLDFGEALARPVRRPAAADRFRAAAGFGACGLSGRRSSGVL